MRIRFDSDKISSHYKRVVTHEWAKIAPSFQFHVSELCDCIRIMRTCLFFRCSLLFITVCKIRASSNSTYLIPTDLKTQPNRHTIWRVSYIILHVCAQRRRNFEQTVSIEVLCLVSVKVTKVLFFECFEKKVKNCKSHQNPHWLSIVG